MVLKSLQRIFFTKVNCPSWSFLIPPLYLVQVFCRFTTLFNWIISEWTQQVDVPVLVHVHHNSFTLPCKCLLMDHNPGIQSAIFAVIQVIYSDYLLVIWHAWDHYTFYPQKHVQATVKHGAMLIHILLSDTYAVNPLT